MIPRKIRIASALALMGTAFCGAQAQQLSYKPSTTDTSSFWNYTPSVNNTSVYIAPEAGFFNPDNRFGTHSTGVEGGLRVGKAINKYFDVQVGGSYARARGENIRYQQAMIGIDGRYFVTRDRIRPFLEVGIGAQNDRRNIPNFQNSRTSPYAAAGAGVQFLVTDQLAAELEYRKVFGFQRSDAFGFRRNENNYATLGVTYYFDKPTTTPVRYEAPPPAAPMPPPPPPPAPPPPPPVFQKTTMSATELFSFDSAKLMPQQSKLDDIASLLQAHPEVTDVRITGYTDRLGPPAYNQKLSQRRADSVKAYLVHKGIDGSRLSTTGKGEADPVVQCSEKNRTALIKCLEPNRRVDVEDITVQKRVQ